MALKIILQVTLDWAKDKDSIKPEDEAKQLPILQIQNPNGRRASSGEFEIWKIHDFRKFSTFDTNIIIFFQF